MIHFVIPTYNRDAFINRCIKSIIDNVNSEFIGSIVVINQNKEPYNFANDAIVEIMYPPAGKAIYKPGVEAIRDKLSSEDILCFLDDDIVINSTFQNNFKRLSNKLLEEKTGCIQLSFGTCKIRDDFVPIQYGFKGGGIAVQVKKYFDFDGHGDDYYDDIELYIRAYIKGYQNYRCRFINSQHDLNKKLSGGIRGYFNDILGIKRCGYKYSKLKETYKGWLLPANNFMGFRLKKR